MKNIVLLATSLTCFIMVAQETRQNVEKVDMVQHSFEFRGLKWGSTREEVKSIIKDAILYDEAENLMYSSDVSGLDAQLVFWFKSGKMNAIAYIFKEPHSSRNLYIEDYEKIKSLLIEKYGLPADEQERWLDDLYKDDPNDKGMAIAIGHLVISSIWRFPDTEITHGLTGDNYEITHLLSYKSTKILSDDTKKPLSKL